MKRLSIVKDVKIDAVTLGSIAQFGDNEVIEPESRALAVQREKELFFGDEGNFQAYPIFTANIPEPSFKSDVRMKIHHSNPIIQVGSIEILGVSAASVFQVGSNRVIDSETRIKHIRQLLRRESLQ